MTQPAMTKLADLTAALLDAARRAGATDADAVAVSGESLSVDVRGGGLEHAERADGVEIGLRVLIGGRQACVSASDLSARTLEEMAGRAVAMAREAPVDDNLGLARADQLCADMPALDLDDAAPLPEPERLLDLALRAEAAALEQDGISMTESAGASAMRRQLWLAGSNGFSAGYARSSHGLSVVAITGEGTAMERDWASESRVWAADMPTPEEIGHRAAERTLARRGARKPPTGSFPILYDERVAATLVGHLLSAANGSAVARGASWLRNDLGQPVLPDGFDLTEDPRLSRLASLRRRGAGHGCSRDRRGRRVAGLDAGSGDGPQAGDGIDRERRARHLVAAVARRVERDAARAGRRQPRRPDPRHGAGAGRDLDAGGVDQSDDRRLFAGRRGVLGRERADRPCRQ